MSALENALNSFLSLDAQSAKYLAPLAGKVISITIQPFNETLYLCPSDDSIQILDYSSIKADTQLTGSAFAFGLMGISASPMRSIFSGSVKIEGDMHTGRKFQELFAQLELNLEPLLARYTGDTIANNLSQLFRSGKNWGNESVETFNLNLSEFLQEETRDLPSAPEIDIFYTQVDNLRTDFDRLQSRIERIQKTHSKGNS
ncbi:MAG: SCP2 sterol-binding domain-containing protein [Methylococcales bacterium]|nr:SCP2 sterol-binding domain-containing protein [Methylococcales bacterium]